MVASFLIRRSASVLVLAVAASALTISLPWSMQQAQISKDTIDLDLPPEKRWVEFASKHRDQIIGRARGAGVLYERMLGPEVTAAWVSAAPMSDDMRAEFNSLVRTVNHSAVTFSRLVILDFWQAVHAPSFGCTGMLMAQSDGTVIHGRNVDYEVDLMLKAALETHADPTSGGDMFDGTFVRGGKPIASFLGFPGGLGTHTGIRYGGYTFNSNARVKGNNQTENLLNMQLRGSLNFPWVARRVLTEIPTWEGAVEEFKNTNFNAPNYFIFGGVEPYQGAVVTKDSGSTKPLPGTPDVQYLSKETGAWHLVQTNDDLLEPPDDNRRGTALNILSTKQQSQVDENFVLNQMTTAPVFNSDTLLTWIGNAKKGTYSIYQKNGEAVRRDAENKILHRMLHLRMPQDLPGKEPPSSPLTVEEAQELLSNFAN
mmetsp:Transcript_79589/g.170671  ORF Transcript_79589/g.170671 Transcript_79589/m.170671 type:complete len:427 (-) Transcript_79589:146-1426(-)